MKQNYFILVLFISFFCFHALHAKVKLPSIFSNNMVLQQQSDVPFWGEATPNKTVKITASWNNKTYETVTDALGNWKTKVSTPVYGGPYTVEISDGSKIKLENVMIGEVWLCSGQSNMQMPLAGWGKVMNYEQEIAAANYPNIRLFEVERNTDTKPIQDLKAVDGGWVACSPKTVAEFSSVAYFFAKNIFDAKDIPIGLISTSWGGTICEAWTSGAALKTMPDFVAPVLAMEKSASQGIDMKKNFNQEMTVWKELVDKTDTGFSGGKAQWTSLNVDESSWKPMNIPGYIEAQGLAGFDGVIWMRKTIDIPADWENKVLSLNLDMIDDNDITYFNGVQIGHSEGYNVERKYSIPAKLVKAGKAVITVRLFDFGGNGGIYGEAKKIKLSADREISLAGSWLYKAGFGMNEVPPVPAFWNEPNRPTVLFNAMLNPIIPFTIKGVLWYQGEANTSRAYQYRELFPLMIKDWRKRWNSDFPFYFVQLANYIETGDQASTWAELREAQLQTLHLENTGMAVTIDIGDAIDIHPKNKQEVGRRLALIAQANLYDQKIPYSGPIYGSYRIEGNTIRIKFNHVNGGLRAKNGDSLKGFEIAGLDHQFHSAEGQIVGNDIVVSCKQVEHPVAVRYAWADNPICNLYNGANLPASPFRTDDWPGITIGNK
jgi:sialate O-acetylesterase